jgi:SAM-dependent methyltransferase
MHASRPPLAAIMAARPFRSSALDGAPAPMTAQPDLLDRLACPRCDQALAAHGDGFRCGGCRVDFPRVEAIPWLFAEPAAALGEWRGRLHFSLQRNDRDEQRLRAALERPDLRAPTRARLERLAAATADHGTRLRALLAPLEIERHAAPVETHLALRTRLPSDQGLTTYYANVHRDWCWGGEENDASFAIVDAALAGASAGSVLVLGAGAGRLAYDAHERWGNPLTIALDFNPLLMLLAQRVARGERVELYEFPIAPRAAADHAVLRALGAPAAARAGFHCVLGDAHRPPFARGSFDTVITPWLVDILPEQFDVLCARINALLAPGGRWLNFGSLSFHVPDAASRYGVEECAAVIEEAGFAAPAVAEHEIPYLCSPASRHGRREHVVAWRAEKARDVKKLPRYEALPDWIVRGSEPVPAGESFRTQAMSTRIHAFIMSLIDGRRSLKDMAKVLVDQRLMNEHEAEPAIRSFLIKMYEDSRRGSSY